MKPETKAGLKAGMKAGVKKGMKKTEIKKPEMKGKPEAELQSAEEATDSHSESESEAEADTAIQLETEQKTDTEQRNTQPDTDPQTDPQPTTFAALGLMPALCDACTSVGYPHPTSIQSSAIPAALSGRDIIGLAHTGSGKTAAFALPILHALWEAPQPVFALVLAPTRELAFQISAQFQALGQPIGVQVATIVGGMDMLAQSIVLAKKPHIIVATPGRLQDHLENTRGFSLAKLRYLVFDEADKLLDQDFGPVIDKLLKVIPSDRTTFLFSATMTTKVNKLQRASLRNPVKLQISDKNTTVPTLAQYYLFPPLVARDAHLVYIINEHHAASTIIFTRTVHDCQRIAILLRLLGFDAVPLHGQLSQSHRLGALNKFRSGGRNILVATDVASRGLDIPNVDIVINYDTPTDSKDYIHRVGRTARAGKAGTAITLVTQYDVEIFQRIELYIGLKLEEYPHSQEAILLLSERVGEAQREAIRELKENGVAGKGGKRGRDDMDVDDEAVDIAQQYGAARGRGGSRGGRGGRGGRGSGRGRGRGRS